MPFVSFDEERLSAEAPTLDQFQYLAPPDFSGLTQPGCFEGAPKEIRKVADALRSIAVKQLYCRYDGGSDEGFAWPDSAVMQDGSRISYETLLDRLMNAASPDEIKAGFGLKAWPPSRSDLDQEINYPFCYELATLLLGDLYGTGELSLFGAFTADLETNSVVDDPKAKPVVRNVEIAELDE